MRKLKKQGSGVLLVIGTPLGNMGDMTERAVEALKKVDVLACEDTRRVGLLLQKLGVRVPRLVSSHKDNERFKLDELVSMVRDGLVVGLVSDGGMPGISDPGAVVVGAVREAGFEVEVIPGPTAVATAVAGSGFEGGFVFVGFLPRKGKDRKEALARLETYPETVVIYESPLRLEATCAELLAAWGNRPAYIARELTKLYEEWLGADLAGLVEGLSGEALKGECVLVVRGFRPDPAEALPLPGGWENEVGRRLLAGEGAKEVAAFLAAWLGITKREAYARVMEVKHAG